VNSKEDDELTGGAMKTVEVMASPSLPSRSVQLIVTDLGVSSGS